jgi:hypothetical protein
MAKDDMEMEDEPRSFRCEKAIGRLINQYAKAWERSESFVIKLFLRQQLKDQLPNDLKPRNWK